VSPLEEQVKYQAKLLQLLIWALAGTVLMLVVRVELNMLADGK
jgi:hypothetical protein